MTTETTQLDVDFTGIDEESELYELLELAEETIKEEPGWEDSRVAQFVAIESGHLHTSIDNKDLETLAELRKHSGLNDSDLDRYRPREYDQSGASATIEAIIKRSIDMFVYNRIIESPTNN